MGDFQLDEAYGSGVIRSYGAGGCWWCRWCRRAGVASPPPACHQHLGAAAATGLACSLSGGSPNLAHLAGAKPH